MITCLSDVCQLLSSSQWSSVPQHPHLHSFGRVWCHVSICDTKNKPTSILKKWNRLITHSAELQPLWRPWLQMCVAPRRSGFNWTASPCYDFALFFTKQWFRFISSCSHGAACCVAIWSFSERRKCELHTRGRKIEERACEPQPDSHLRAWWEESGGVFRVLRFSMSSSYSDTFR